ILNGGAHCLDTVKELILQPQSDIQEVRRWLYRHNYRIIVEDIVFEDGKYYPMMKAIHGQDEKFSDEELYYGRTSQQRSKEVLLSYLQKKACDGKKIQEILQKNGQEHSVRMKELKKDEKRIRRFVKKLTEPSSVVSKKEEMS
ncbi:MAG: class I SAM-dependent methyltransferase, partial [Lachnospiraceae bacterium]|nr:class I SAM-dependent methyltransferase [Lachnospiraceae bacterium]